jgi:hypothetical protein
LIRLDQAWQLRIWDEQVGYGREMKINWKVISRILLIFLVTRVLLGVWMWGIRQLLPARPPSSIINLYKGTSIVTDPWLEPWQRWDTPQYQAIAERGYSAFETALFTPPLYPLLMQLTRRIAGGNTLVSGMIVSGIASLMCLFVFFRLGTLELGDKIQAQRAVLYLAIFPTAFFLFAAYTESLFLLGVMMALLSVRSKKWIWAGIWGAVVALTRTPGSLILVPLAWAAWSARSSGDYRGWISPVITLAGAALFPIYVSFGLHLSPIAILTAVGRGGRLAFPGLNIIEAINRILQGQLVEENLFELTFTLFFIILTIAIWKKLPRLYGVYSVTMMLFFLTRFGSPQPLVSMTRYVLEIFPAFLVLTTWGSRPWINRLILYTSWLGLLFFSAQFAIWGWVG